ncbi:MAG TPA: hypothetical protein HA260_02015 [Thermoplasmata archaeon]|nr:hypothetical protein [Thermoplasmata archaeon]
MEKNEGMEPGEMSYKKTSVAEDIWDQSEKQSMTCPQCKGFLTVVQVEPIYDPDNAYTPYRTVVECASCSFRMVTESYTILGGIKNFDDEYVEIGSWGPSGSRVISRFKHSISSSLLSELKKSQELVEFLVVNEHVVQVIG